MTHRYKLLFLIIIFFSINLFAQSNKILSGPMVSYVDAYSTQVWFLLESEVKKIDFEIRNYEDDKLLQFSFNVTNKHNLDEIPFTVLLDKLQPNKEYMASVFVDDVLFQEIDIFTQRPHLDNMQFLISSGLNKQPNDIFHNMKKTNSDLVVWLGNHVYPDTTFSFNNMINEYAKVRKNDNYNDLITSTPQIATWGGLDYGLDRDASWVLKDSAHIVFELFWPNSLQKTYNYTFFDYGTYQKYTYSDVDIFLLDAQTFQSKTESDLYGDKQIERLFQEIHNNGATFTIIASSVPFTFDTEDSFLNYQKQFDYFLYRLEISQLNSVLLLSSSKHKDVQMNQLSLSNNKMLYEFNVPSLESNFYSLINIHGEKGSRYLSFETYNQNGNLMYKKKFNETELQLN